MANQKGGDRLDTVIKLVLIFFISLASFSVGTFVGKGVSDSEYRQAALEKGDYKNFETAGGEEKAKSEEGALSEREVASLTQEFLESEKKEQAAHGEAATGHEERSTASEKAATVDAHAGKIVEKAKEEKVEAKDGYTQVKRKKGEAAEGAAHAKAEANPHETKTASEEHKPAAVGGHAAKGKAEGVAPAAERLAEGKAPAKEMHAPRLPNSVLPAVSSSVIGKYTVQVASYASEKEAEGHVTNLKGKGFSAFYVTAKVQDKTWFRVSVGTFANYKSAMDFREELMKQANISSALVQKIVQ